MNSFLRNGRLRKRVCSETGFAAGERARQGFLCRVHESSDRLTEWIVWGMVISSPWAFGTTEEWSMGVMNVAGYALGVLWLCKVIARQFGGAKSEDWGESEGISRRAIQGLGGATVLILGYCLLSALNARCVYLGDYQYQYYPCVEWLPHSYDGLLTWQAFRNYLALALSFWAIRDWLMAGERRERGQLAVGRAPALTSSPLMPRRLKRLLWVLSINGAVLATEGLVQRAVGTGKLLWLVEPHINKAAEAQFGPYAYRSNAAQYFLLVWPVVLGFWSALSGKSGGERPMSMRHHLLPCILIMAIIPLMSLSRAGAIIGVLAIIGAIAMILWSDREEGNGPILGITVLLGVAMLLGGYLEWDNLTKRFEEHTLDTSRLEIWRNTWQAFKQHPVFGTGPGSFSSVYGFYWSGKDEGTAQAHNDWLETLMTFGTVGSALVIGALLLLAAHQLAGGNLGLGKVFPKFIYIGLGSCLLYAVVDFPLTIYSILFVFILECAVLTSCPGAAGGGSISAKKTTGVTCRSAGCD